MRINKFISENSGYSRRAADLLIKNGEVKVNGKTLKTPGLIIDPDKDEIIIKGQKINRQNEKIYLALNKPRGYITTRSDELNRKTVMDLLPAVPNLKPAGRLDKDTEGLLIISNDGNFINRLTHPGFACEKEYLVELDGPLSAENKAKLEKGVPINGRRTSKSRIKILKSSDKKTLLIIKIHEGRNRQIRKMFEYINSHVKYLKRLKIGKIVLKDLKKGQIRKLTEKEINAFKSP